MYSPDDYNFSPMELVTKYKNVAEQPHYSRATWAALLEPKLPYWTWVVDCLNKEKDSLRAISSHVLLDSTATTAVDINYHWQPMSTCPRGCKVQLKGKGGVAIYGQYNGSLDDNFWVGWAPLPTTKKD